MKGTRCPCYSLFVFPIRLATLRIDHHNVTPRFSQGVANTLAKTAIPTGDHGDCPVEFHTASPRCAKRSDRTA